MKKTFLLLSVVILFGLTGCDPNKDFSKTCVKENKTNDYKERITTTINYNNNDEVTNVTIEKTYNIKDKEILSSIKESSESYNEALKKANGIDTQVFENEKLYKIIYHLYVPDVSDENLENFEIKRNSIKYFNYLKKNKIECQ